MDWAVFAGAVLCTMLVNRLLFGGATHRISFREAALRSTVWVLAAAGFAGFIFYRHGHHQAITFAVAYLVEQSLSVDNLFVFLVVFTYFSISDAVPGARPHLGRRRRRVDARRFHPGRDGACSTTSTG